jgi:hypothetical protein
VRLALLVAGTALPLIVFAAVLVFEDYEHDRKAASQRVVETVRGIRLVLDAEVARMTGGSRYWRLPTHCVTAISTAFAASLRAFWSNTAGAASCWWRTVTAASCSPRPLRTRRTFRRATTAQS